MKQKSVCLLFLLPYLVVSQYTPDWPSIDNRPLPTWFDEGKVGIFIHWGVYSAPAVSNEWFGAEWFEWAYISGHNYPADYGMPTEPPGPGSQRLAEYMRDTYPPGTVYADLAKDLTAEAWNPDEWVELFENAGAKYVVFTSKHHEGFTMWPSNYSDPPNWNAMSQGPERDVVGELAAAVRRGNMHFGLYYSLCEWLHPLWLQDKRSNFSSTNFVDQIAMPKLYELVNTYEPELIWGDGEWSHDWYWNSTVFLAWLYNESPVKDSVIVNDRWGWDTMSTHGGYWTGMDRWNPGVLQPHKWENCMSLDRHSWGYRSDTRVPEDYLRMDEIIPTMVETVSCGGNLLINVGPTRNGSIAWIEQQLLTETGEWLRMNGDAIYGSVPHTVQKDQTTEGTWYTSNAQKTVTYALVTKLPTENRVHLGSIPYEEGLTIQLLGNPGNLSYSCVIPCQNNPGISVQLPPLDQINAKYTWALAISRN